MTALARIWTLGLFATFLGGAACGGEVISDPDAAVDAAVDAPDAMLDASAPVDAPPDATPQPSGHAVTSGGGVASSAAHRIQVRLGAPVPTGQASSAGHAMRLGPGALPWTSP